MGNIMKKMQQVALSLLLVGVLALAGCGGGSSDAEGGNGGSGDAAEQPTRAALPTMPSARFDAPTTMITPASSEPEVQATAALTGTEEMTSTEELTATVEMTDTE